MHVACTEFLTALHTGGRSADDINAGSVLPGYAGTIVRDGYAGYDHLAGALHAWCGTGCATSRTCTSSTPQASSGPGPWPTC